MGVRIHWIKFDGAVVVRDGAVHLAARSQRASAVEEGDRAVRVEHDRAVIVSNGTLDVARNRVEIATGDMDRCALRDADFAPRQGFEETRAGGDRWLGRCGIVGIDTRIAIGRYLGRLRERCCRNTIWDRKEKKCDSTALERVHGCRFLSGGLPLR
jgi:hypothetical protein